MRDLIDRLTLSINGIPLDEAIESEEFAGDFIRAAIEESFETSLRIDESLLLEIDTSPDALRQQAAAIQGARAGMEFEMIVPGGRSAGELASSFKRAIQRPVNYSDRYHGALRARGTYCLEPDSSLRPSTGRGGRGWEFVSPALKVNDMLSDLKKIKRWAVSNRCYTNATCGLHMNVSIPLPQGKTLQQKLNYTKLVLLMGDEFVLRQFGRTANAYCKSALKTIKERARGNRRLAASALRQVQGDFLKKAGRMIHDGRTVKYTSVNNKGNYIEFRSPGGDYLNKPTEMLELTLLRFVVALDAACDTNKYRRLYRARLEALLNGNDPMSVRASEISNQRNLEVSILADLFSFEKTPEELAEILIGEEGMEIEPESKMELAENTSDDH